ncbi:MAG: hypothetical protein AAB691_00690 [Patescibacteria group bacterium]
MPSEIHSTDSTRTSSEPQPNSSLQAHSTSAQGGEQSRTTSSGQAKQCVDCQKDFLISDNELGMYEKVGVILPGQCFFCRSQQQFAFWNFGKFRKGVSALSGQNLITVLPVKTRYPVYTAKEWFSDAWEPVSMGYDPKRPFLDQLKELQEKIPRPHQTGENSINCDWCDDVWESKNCYLSRALANCEEVSYGYRVVRIKDSLDLTYCYDSERSYDCTYCFNCFNVHYAFNCRNAIDSKFLFDCRNVQNCFMCWNLRGKQYCILNQQYTKEEYFQKLGAYRFGSWQVVQELKSEWEQHIREEAVHRENFNVKVADSVGNYLTNCNRCVDAFHWEDSENCYNVMRGLKSKDLIDVTGSWQIESTGNSADMVGGYGMKYSMWCLHCRYSEYLDLCWDCEYCFGCVGIRKKRYTILNKQYPKEEYEKLRDQIIQSMKDDGSYGKFFPYDMALSGYNTSNAQIYFPETKEKVLARGGFWDEVDESKLEGLSTAELPDDISEVEDGITTQALICPQTGYRFNIAPQELNFYRQYSIPLPRLHFDARSLNRFKPLLVIEPTSYHCVCCKKEIQAYYPPEWGYKKVACESCYSKEIA